MRFWAGVLNLCAVCFSLCGNQIIENREIMETDQKTQYLYKILSMPNWEATQNSQIVSISADDNAFIHLALEDQLERILNKYWSEAHQYVILKVDVSKLEGTLRYETNEGGTTKYYHLYQGVIPLSAIVESKVVIKS